MSIDEYRQLWRHDVQWCTLITLFFFHHKKNLIVKTASLNSILFYVCRSFGHVNWPQLSDWCVILDRQLCSALYSVFKHSGDSSVSCQHVGLWDSIVQMLLSQTRRFHCQRELAALIKHHYMCHYACAWALCKVFGPLHPQSCTLHVMIYKKVCICEVLFGIILYLT